MAAPKKHRLRDSSTEPRRKKPAAGSSGQQGQVRTATGEKLHKINPSGKKEVSFFDEIRPQRFSDIAVIIRTMQASKATATSLFEMVFFSQYQVSLFIIIKINSFFEFFVQRSALLIRYPYRAGFRQVA